MIHGTSSGDSPDDGQVVFPDKFNIDLPVRILMFPDDYRRRVPPQHDHIIFREVPKDIFLGGQVEEGVGTGPFNEKHFRIVFRTLRSISERYHSETSAFLPARCPFPVR